MKRFPAPQRAFVAFAALASACSMAIGQTTNDSAQPPLGYRFRFQSDVATAFDCAMKVLERHHAKSVSMTVESTDGRALDRTLDWKAGTGIDEHEVKDIVTDFSACQRLGVSSFSWSHTVPGRQ